jgi:hypothetical protein
MARLLDAMEMTHERDSPGVKSPEKQGNFQSDCAFTGVLHLRESGGKRNLNHILHPNFSVLP